MFDWGAFLGSNLDTKRKRFGHSITKTGIGRMQWSRRIRIWIKFSRRIIDHRIWRKFFGLQGMFVLRYGAAKIHKFAHGVHWRVVNGVRKFKFIIQVLKSFL